MDQDSISKVPVISEVKLKIKRVKLRNKELSNKIFIQEIELHNYELRLSKYLKEICDLKNEIITFKKDLDIAMQAKHILKIEICKRDNELKLFKARVHKYVLNENEFINTSKLLENEKRKLKKTERVLRRITKLLESRTNTIKNIRDHMKEAHCILIKFGKMLNDDKNKLSSKHKKYLKTVEEEYLKDIFCDGANCNIVPKIEQDADDLQVSVSTESFNLDPPLEFTDDIVQKTASTIEEGMNIGSCRNSQFNKCLANSICSTSKISSSSIISISLPKSTDVQNKGETLNTSDNPTINIGVSRNFSKPLSPIAFSSNSFCTAKNADSVGYVDFMHVVNLNEGEINDSFNRGQFCSLSSSAKTQELPDEQESDSENEMFESTVSVTEVAQRIQRLKHENEELKTKNIRQESELRNYELKLSKCLTELFDIINERNGVKEALDKTEEEKSTLEIRFGEREGELKQFRELVQKYVKSEEDAINTSKELKNKKKELEKAEKELLHATNLLKIKTATLKKERGKHRKVRNTLLQFGKIINERGINITSKQKKYLKEIETKHLKDVGHTDKADKETVVPKIETEENDYLQGTDNAESLSIDVSLIKQEII